VRKRFLIAVSVPLSVLAAMLLVACADNSVPAPRSSSTESSPPATGPIWPMLGGNPQRTGESPFRGPDEHGVLWSVGVGDHEFSSPAIGADGTVYVGGGNKLYAVDAEGAIKWTFRAGGAVWSSPAIAADGTIYVGTNRGDTPGHTRGRLFAVRPNGTQKWEFDPGDWVQSSPAVASDGTIYVCSSDGRLHALDPDGRSKWAYESRGNLWGSPPAVGLDDTVYFVATFMRPGDRLYAVARSGKLRWEFAGKWSMGDTPVIGPDGTIYVLDDYGQVLHALDSRGVEKWTFAFARQVTDASSPQPRPPGHVALSPAISPDGTICVVCTDGRVYGLTADGSQQWQVDVGGHIGSSPVIGADGTIFISGDGVTALGPDGTRRWTTLNGNSVSTAPAIGADGTAVCVVGDTLTAIGGRP